MLLKIFNAEDAKATKRSQKNIKHLRMILQTVSRWELEFLQIFILLSLTDAVNGIAGYILLFQEHYTQTYPMANP